MTSSSLFFTLESARSVTSCNLSSVLRDVVEDDQAAYREAVIQYVSSVFMETKAHYWILGFGIGVFVGLRLWSGFG